MDKENQLSEIELSLMPTDITNESKSEISTTETSKSETNRLPPALIKLTLNNDSSTAPKDNKSQRSKQLKFVNSSPVTISKPKSRMKPTFKINTHMIQQRSPPTTELNNPSAASTRQTPKRPRIAPNDKSIIIEQRFDLLNNVFVSDNQKEYQFQEQVKRPPGRPRKHPIEMDKVKRPQGRPRKNPLPLEPADAKKFSAVNSKHKKRAFDLITMSVPPLKKQDTTAVQKADPHPMVFGLTSPISSGSGSDAQSQSLSVKSGESSDPLKTRATSQVEV